MESILQSLILAGLGTMAYSYEKAASLIDQLIKRGELTLSQGKELNEELKRRMDSTAKHREKGAVPIFRRLVYSIGMVFSGMPGQRGGG